MKKFLINGIEFDLYNKSYTMGIQIGRAHV